MQSIVPIKTIDLSRRKLLKNAAYGIFAGVLGLPICLHSKQPAISTASHELSPFLSNSMKAVGQEYLSQYPAEGTTTALLRAIHSRIDNAEGRTTGLHRAALKKMLR